MIAYADTGFLMSLYASDANSAVATASVKSNPIFFLTRFLEIEFLNALELRVFRKELTTREVRLVHDQFLHDQAAGVFRSEPLGAEVWENALILARRHSAVLGTRTLDLLHIATALVLKPDVFYTFDQRQRSAATAERMHVLP